MIALMVIGHFLNNLIARLGNNTSEIQNKEAIAGIILQNIMPSYITNNM